MPVVSINPVFANQLTTLKTENAYIAAASRVAAMRAWNVPNTGAGWSGSPFDLVGMGLAFDRTQTNLEYKLAVDTATQDGGGRVSDIVAANVQVDYLAAQERAVRSRHMTSVRCKMHAGARRQGHATAGGVFDGVLRHALNAIKSGVG